jgi:transcription elongation factor Elf1
VEIIDVLPRETHPTYKFKILCPECEKPHLVSSANLRKNQIICKSCKPRNQKYKKGDLIGHQKIKFVSEKTYLKSNNRERYGMFECPYCGRHFERSIGYILKAKDTPLISCGCQSDKTYYYEGDYYGDNKHKLITLHPNIVNQDRKAIFECGLCGNHFESSCKSISKNIVNCCGCSNPLSFNKGDLIGKSSIEVIEPNHIKDCHGKIKSIFKCPKCEKPFESLNTLVRNNYVRHCGCDKFVSNPEREVRDFIQEIYDHEIVTNSKAIINNRELDIFLPQANLAIEVNGLYWHNSEEKETTYHLDKTNRCKELGIDLIHIFSHNWTNKQDICKDIIKKRLNIVDKKIYARKCEIRELRFSEVDTFLEENHLQGSVKSKINLGLYFQDELVSLMTFGKPRSKSNYEFELYRFCNKLGTSVIGGASKLLKFFEIKYNYPSLLSFCDISVFNGELYYNLGFELSHQSKPNYFYFQQGRENIVYSRNKFMKHKLKNELDNFDPDLSEYQNMLNNKYLRYYDCGNFVFTKNIKKD